MGISPCLYVFTIFFQTLSHTASSKVPFSETRDYNNKQLASNIIVVILILVLIHSLKDDSHLDIRQSPPGFCPMILRHFLLWGSPVFHLRASFKSLRCSEGGGTWENGADKWGRLKSLSSTPGRGPSPGTIPCVWRNWGYKTLFLLSWSSLVRILLIWLHSWTVFSQYDSVLVAPTTVAAHR